MTEVARREPQEVIEAVTIDEPHLLNETTDGWVATVAEVAKLARYIAGTDFVPKGLRGNPAGTAAAVLYGRELGVPPMTALQVTHVIHGRVGMAAEMLRAMVLAAGHSLVFVESTSERCKIKGRRQGEDDWTEVAWTMGDATRAGLTAGDSNYKKYPRQMLQARASAELCRMVFPDVIRGMAAVEEIDVDGLPVPNDVGATAASGHAETATRVQRAPRRPRKTANATAELPAPPVDEPPLPDASSEGEKREATDSPPADPPVDEPPADDAPAAGTSTDEPELRTAQQSRALWAGLRKLGIPEGDAGRADALAMISSWVGREVESTKTLTKAECGTALERMDEINREDEPAAEDGQK